MPLSYTNLWERWLVFTSTMYKHFASKIRNRLRQMLVIKNWGEGCGVVVETVVFFF